MWTQGNDFTFLCLNSDTVFCNSTLENFAKIWPIEQIGIRTKTFLFARATTSSQALFPGFGGGKKRSGDEVARTNLLSDVFAAVPVVTAQAP